MGAMTRLCAMTMLCAGLTAPPDLARAGELACNSLNGEFSRCALKDADKLRIRLKLDREGGCKKNDTWGVDADGVWVDMGCSAVFSFKAPSERGWWQKLLSVKR